MKPDKAPGYWPTRILLVIAILLTAATVGLALWAISWESPMFGGDRASILGLPVRVVLPAVAAGIALLGLARTIRVFRGPRQEPPSWRYRDH